MISWNVNGIRSCMTKGLAKVLAEEEADIVCLQETKIDAAAAQALEFSRYPYVHFHSGERKGYSGTAVLARKQPLGMAFDFVDGPAEPEGRVMTLEFDGFYLVNAYVPNSQNELRRLDYRIGQWEPALRRHLRELQKKKPVIYCGDLNVAHREIDLARPSANRRSAGFTDEERAAMDELLDLGLSDTFRHFHPHLTGAYSWWSYRGGARDRNVGWRIDYVLLSKALLPRLKSAFIRPEITGSDHCPVGIEIETDL